MPALVTATSPNSRVRPSIARAGQRASSKSFDGEPKAETDAPSPVSESQSLQKTLRGYEHERQRTKRTAETERLRERKERYRQAWLTSSRPSRATPHGKRVAAKGDTRSPAGAEDVDDCRYEENAPRDGEEAQDPTAAESGTPPIMQELDLAALMKPAKIRKHRGHDFEVVDNIPSVIALEDRPYDDLELDEPWEHVSFEQDAAAPPSYAQIVIKA